MRALLLLSVAITVCAESQYNYALRGYHEGDRFFYFPGDDGIPYLVDAEEPIDFQLIQQYVANDYNRYWLYTRQNPTSKQYLTHGDINSIISSNYDRSKVTVFIAHGWITDGSSLINQLLTEAFLHDGDVNVIVLDWSQLAYSRYTTAKAGVAAVGAAMGQFINWLVNNGLASYNLIHLVGFSLGGHLVGNAGRATGGAVMRITALDPAGPLWRSDKNRIVATDGRYVEVIHTNTFLYGYTDPCGDADFYPNGGSRMPGCWFNFCSHGRSYEYMASTVKLNHLWAKQCGSYRDVEKDSCRGPLQPMGNSDLYKKARGIYRVNTGKDYPFII